MSELARELARTSVHEAGHLVAATMLRGSVGYASVRRSQRWAGVARANSRRVPSADIGRSGVPVFVMLPARVRAALEHDVIIGLAGPIAERTYAPDWVEAAADALARRTAGTIVSPVLPAREAEAIAQGNADLPLNPTDEENARESTRVLVGDEELVAAQLEVLRGVTVRLVALVEFERHIAALVPALLEHIDLSGADVRRILRGGQPCRSAAAA